MTGTRVIAAARELWPETSALPLVHDLQPTHAASDSHPACVDGAEACVRPQLRGIAALAANGEVLDQRNVVEYHSLHARSILNRCTSPRVPFTWTINPYRGCEFACQYCYARYTHEFMELREPIDFERKIFVKQRAAELLLRDLRRVKRNESIAFGTATDPYQPAERRYGVTRSLLTAFAQVRGFRLGLITKSDLVGRDIDLLQQISAHNRLVVRLTITTTDIALSRMLEPRTPRPDLRLRAVEKLRTAGIETGVMCAPVLPGITDGRDQLDQLIAASAAAGAQFFNANALFLKPSAQAHFMPFLRERFPELVEKYRDVYAGSAFLDTAYHRQLQRNIRELTAKHGIRTSSGYEAVECDKPAEQPNLF